MDPSSMPSRDVFIIYTKAEAYEAALVEAVKERLYDWGLTA